jgi:hypothetical protein
MQKPCDLCHNFIRDEEEIIAVVKTVFHQVPSRVSYAIQMPTECLKMFHIECAEGREGSHDTEIE